MAKFCKGNKAAKGGARQNAGRPPAPKTVLARLALAELDEEAEKSIQFLVNARDNPEIPWGIRVEAARDLINRRFGKPRQAHDVRVGRTLEELIMHSWGDKDETSK